MSEKAYCPTCRDVVDATQWWQSKGRKGRRIVLRCPTCHHRIGSPDKPNKREANMHYRNYGFSAVLVRCSDLGK